jgi:hypothetical protein
MIIILDALDECGDAESRRTLLQVLSSGLAKLPPDFRILVTSRKEFDITSALSPQPNIDPRPLAAAGNDDIEHFFRHSLADTTIRFDLRPDWLNVNVIPQLTRLSEGLWIWASTAVKFIESDNYPPRQLKHLLPTSSHIQQPAGIGKLYATALRQSANWSNPAESEECRAILGAVVVARLQPSEALLDRLLKVEGQVGRLLKRLGCVLEVEPNGLIQVLHTSFTDYLCDGEACGSLPWFVDPASHHHSLAMSCFTIMRVGLHFNICGLESLYERNSEVKDMAKRIEGSISMDLRYAVNYWADHFSSAMFTINILKSMNEFMHAKFLYWVEVMSLLGNMPSAHYSLGKAMIWLKASSQPPVMSDHFAFMNRQLSAETLPRS